MKLIYFAIALIVLSGGLQAEEVGYEVEVIIFEDITSTYQHSELWNEVYKAEFSTSTEIDAKKPKTITSGTALKNDFEFLPDNQLRLANHSNKINEHQDFRVLYHRAWKQRGLDKEFTFPVAIDSRQSRSEGSTKLPSSQGIEDGQPPLPYIDGTITLIMSRYLHINTDLVFHKHSTDTSSYGVAGDSSTGKMNSYSIKFERRMRSREVHYIDHPLVGIIVLATPYKIAGKNNPNDAAQQYKSL